MIKPAVPMFCQSIVTADAGLRLTTAFWFRSVERPENYRINPRTDKERNCKGEPVNLVILIVVGEQFCDNLSDQ